MGLIGFDLHKEVRHLLDEMRVVVFVTSEDILMCIIIVCFCTPIGDVCYSFT